MRSPRLAPLRAVSAHPCTFARDATAFLPSSGPRLGQAGVGLWPEIARMARQPKLNLAPGLHREAFGARVASARGVARVCEEQL